MPETSHDSSHDSVDLNCDIGEGFGAWAMGEDDALLALVTSANIACGYHAGDAVTMARTCRAAAQRGVRIGAHVGYGDLAGFGRRALAVAPAQLREETLHQVAALAGFARAAGDRVRYVKPHGALYHAAAAQPEVAQSVVAGMRAVDADLALLGPAGSAMDEAAGAAGIAFWTEGYADRAYTAAGALAPRGVAGSVLELDAARAQALAIVTRGQVQPVDGDDPVTVTARSLCVHSDSPGAVAIAGAVREALTGAGITLAAFT